jgi:hypothetical protein
VLIKRRRKGMKSVNLPWPAPRIARALIGVLKPRKPGFDPQLEDYMFEFLDSFYAYFPLHLKIGLPLGFLLLEFGTLLFHGWFRPFSFQPLEARERYIQGWVNSRFSIRRDLIKGVKAACLIGYYAHPEVMKHLGYDLPAHMKRVNSGEACNPESVKYFRELGYDRNSKIPCPGTDRVRMVCNDDTMDPGKGRG